MSDLINVGEVVRVDFNNSQMTLSRAAVVISKPIATGDSWIFKDIKTDTVHYVSEGCTISTLGYEVSDDNDE